MQKNPYQQDNHSLMSIIRFILLSVIGVAVVYTLASSTMVIAQIIADVLLFVGFFGIVGLAIYYLIKQ
ncbi:MAG: hypothetical protein AAFV98_16805 [Chloroflexota bacterium]